MVFDRFRRKKQEKVELKFTASPENELLFDMATQCLQNKENDEAIKLFGRILESEPDNIHALNGKGSGLMQSDRMSEAEEIFNQSLKIKDNEMAYLNIAIIHGNSGDYETALNYCDKAIELFPHLKDMIQGVKNVYIENMNRNDDTSCEEYSAEARDLIKTANGLKDEGKIWDAWETYERAINSDSGCKNRVNNYINELKASLIQEFMFFDVSMKEGFSIENEADRLNIEIMKELLIDHDFTKALFDTKQLQSMTDENNIDALNYMGAISFYMDEIDDAIEYFEKVAEKGDGVYLFFADFNKTFPLRRKAMITGDLDYMVQALDIYDEMLKDPQTHDKVKPHQRSILDKLQDFMGIPLF